MMRAIKCLKPGGVDALSFVTVPIPVPLPHEILIKVHATALNRADTLQRRGLYNPPAGTTDILGLECSGEVCSDSAQWPRGSKVMGFLRGGGYAEYVAVHKDHVLPMPSALSFIQAAAVAEVWLTAFKCLVHLGKARPHETVLVHAGASGVGTALIALAKWQGLKVIATCGSPEKELVCKELGADLVWNYKNGSFLQTVKEAGGVDLIMDSVGKNYFHDNIESLNKEGRWVVYGFLSGSHVKDFDMMKIFAKLATLHFTSFRSRSDEFRTALIQEFISYKILDQFQSGRFSPKIYKELNFDQVRQGHEIMDRNENSGKIVMRVI